MSKNFWLIDPTKHNKNVTVGNGFKIPDDYMFEDELSPFRGLEVTVMWINNFTKAGYDCFVKLHCSPEELALRYSLIRGAKYTAREIVEWHGHENYSTKDFEYHPGLYVEHNTFDLVRIENNNERILIVGVVHDKTFGNDKVKALFTREDGEFNVRYELYAPTRSSFRRLMRLRGEQFEYLSSSADVDHVEIEYITKYNIEKYGDKRK